MSGSSTLLFCLHKKNNFIKSFFSTFLCHLFEKFANRSFQSPLWSSYIAGILCQFFIRLYYREVYIVTFLLEWRKQDKLWTLLALGFIQLSSRINERCKTFGKVFAMFLILLLGHHCSVDTNDITSLLKLSNICNVLFSSAFTN